MPAAPVPTPSAGPPEETGRPDLSRLRIPRTGAARPYRSFPWFLVLCLAALAGAAWLLRGRIAAVVPGSGPPTVRVARAVQNGPGASGASGVSGNGYVVANRQASVATVLSGRLVEIHADEGDVVPEGMVLGRIQYEDYAASWDAAKKRVEVAQAQAVEAARAVTEAEADVPRLDAELAARRREVDGATETLARLEREVERNRSLYERHVIDEGAWDRIRTDAATGKDTLAAAEARATAAQASLKQVAARADRLRAAETVAQAGVAAARHDAEVAAVTLEKTKIRAPFEGLVVRKDAELGEVIAPTGAGNSRGSVFTIVDPASLEVQVELSERRIQSVHEGDAATIVLEAESDAVRPARVRKIWPRADRTKGTIEVRVTFDQLPPIARPEMAARVTFLGSEPSPVAASKPAVTVPTDAVAKREGEDVVFVVEAGVARRRAVRLGGSANGQRAVEEGLEGGELVVRDPSPGLRDGDHVQAGER